MWNVFLVVFLFALPTIIVKSELKAPRKSSSILNFAAIAIIVIIRKAFENTSVVL